MARTVLAACQRGSLENDGSCWNGEIPNIQALFHVLVVENCVCSGEGEQTEDVRGYSASSG